jgi:hypothetical protein
VLGMFTWLGSMQGTKSAAVWSAVVTTNDGVRMLECTVYSGGPIVCNAHEKLLP